MQLLRHLPADTGMAFVLVQHLDPKHESQLTSLLSKATSMPVLEAQDQLAVSPNHVYVIPPNTSMSIHQGMLRLAARPQTHALHLPIDEFFRSLAEDHQSQAIGVVLSGTGSDGTLGLGEIKGVGGIAFAQDGKSAKYSSMPLSAIQSGSVDAVLSPEQIAGELARIGHHAYLRPVPPATEAASPVEAEDDYRRIVALLRSSTRVDFTDYRDTTIRRRIARRMAVQKLDALGDYRRYLEGNPAEVEALYRDILINVTSFFRDPEVFEALKAQVFPEITKDKSPEVPIRIWAPGCSTGQETYSLAMALVEFLDERALRLPIQIFGTDISDTASVEVAREGLYPANIESQVSPERLRRFFVKEGSGYRIGKVIRDMCLFAKQNVAADPPFSKVDLISCRNLLIYLSGPLQQRIIPTFHYALNVPGFLLLGASESIGRFTDLFSPADSRSRIFAKTATGPRAYPHFAPEAHAPQALAGKAPGERLPTTSDLQREADRVALGRFAPAGVLVNEELEVLQYRGRTGPYLEPPPGEVNLNLLRMARENLFAELRSAIEEAREKHSAVRREGVPLQGEQGLREIALEVIPIKLPASTRGGFLVFFEEPQTPPAREKSGAPPAAIAAGGKGTNGQLRRENEQLRKENEQLRKELAATKEYLETVIDQQGAANEELKSANEEILSANEELQSTNEELQTTKEELSSTNEELVTLNEELRRRNQEVMQVNDDLSNLLSSMKMPIVMLGVDLRIRRFTPAAGKVLGLTPADLGRPITNLRLPLSTADLESLLAEVLSSVAPQEREVQDAQGHWYLMRLNPYRTADNRIDGAVLALLDIDELRGAKERLQEARDYAMAIVETTTQPLLILDTDLRVRSANRSFYRTFQVAPPESVGQQVYNLGNGQWASPKLRVLLEEILPQGTSFVDFEVEHDFPAIGRRTMLLNGHRLETEGHQTQLMLLAFEDVTERRQADQQRAKMIEMEATAAAKDQFLASLSHELRTPLTPVLMTTSALEARQDLPVEVQAELAVMRRNIALEAKLIDDLLDLTRITRGKMDLDVQPQSPCELLEHVLGMCRPDIEAKELRVDVDLGCKKRCARPCVMADGPRLQQVFWNLLRNAIKFTPDHGRITVRCQVMQDRLVIQVADTGMGIEPEVLSRLFNAFEQGTRDTTRQFGGLGLGLAISKAIIEQHRGTIRAESRGKGRGATFTIELPVIPEAERVEAEARRSAAISETEPTSEQPPLRLLIVEDHADTARLLRQLLMTLSHQVEVAHDVTSAKELAGRQGFDLVISDLGLPDGSGAELMTYLKQQYRLKGIALTGYGMENDRARTREAGFVEHLVKPIDFEQLQAAIVRASRQKE